MQSITAAGGVWGHFPRIYQTDFKMTEKYSETLSSIGNEIKQTQKELFELMDELTGNEFDMKGHENLKGIFA